MKYAILSSFSYKVVTDPIKSQQIIPAFLLPPLKILGYEPTNHLFNFSGVSLSQHVRFPSHPDPPPPKLLEDLPPQNLLGAAACWTLPFGQEPTVDPGDASRFGFVSGFHRYFHERNIRDGSLVSPIFWWEIHLFLRGPFSIAMLLCYFTRV